jgi:nitrate/nitrite-specific signal transduction histidine kinase
VQPIEQVRAFAASVDAGNFKARLAEHGPPEILALMQDMNRMATNLGERDALLRRNKALTGEVRSHESRMAAFEAIEVDFAELGDLNLLMRRMLEGVVQVVLALEVARELGLPLMGHLDGPPPPRAEVMALLGKLLGTIFGIHL